MGKLTSYILGLSSAVVIAYLVLSAEYQPLINWLGPTMGSDIIFPFSFLFLLLGSVLIYPVLLGAWILIGVLVGAGARKGTRAIGAAISIYASIWGMLGLSALAVFEKFTGFSPGSTAVTQINTSFPVPPLPPGVTISALLSEPLFQPLASLLNNIPGISSLFFTTSSSAASSSAILSSFLTVFESTFLPALITNFVVFVVISGLVGFGIYRLMNRKDSPGDPGEEKKGRKVKMKKVRMRKVVKKAIHSRSFLAAILPVIMVALFMVSSSANVISNYKTATAPSPNMTQGTQAYDVALVTNIMDRGHLILSSYGLHKDGSTPNLTSSALSLNYGGGYLGKYGNIYDAYAFLNGSSSPGTGIFSSCSTSSTILAAIFISANTETIFNALSQDGIINSSIIQSLQSNKYYNLIPQSTIIEISLGNVSSTSAALYNEASGVSTSIGGSAPFQFLGLNLPFSSASGSSQYMSLFAYSFNTSLSNAEIKLVQNYGDSYFSGGSYPIFSNGILNGTLIPGYGGNSVDASMFVAGEFKPSELPSSLGNYASLVYNASSVTGAVSFMGGLFLHEHVVHSSAATHTISAAQMFGYRGNLSFGGNSTGYALSLMYPQSSSFNAYPNYLMELFSNDRSFSGIGSPATTHFNSISSGSQFNLSSLNFTTNATFPASMNVSQSVSHWTGDIYNVSIVLSNNDTDTLKNVSINAAPLLGIYGNNSQVVKGSTKAFSASLLPGQSLSVAYSLSLSGVGTYVVASPYFNYSMNGTAFNVQGNTLTAYAQPPSVIHAINQVELVSFSALASYVKLPILVQQIYPGIYVFDLIFLLVIVLDVFIEVRAFRKWRAKSKTV